MSIANIDQIVNIAIEREYIYRLVNTFICFISIELHLCNALLAGCQETIRIIQYLWEGIQEKMVELSILMEIPEPFKYYNK